MDAVQLPVQPDPAACGQHQLRVHERWTAGGLQIVGRMFDDAGVLAASAAYETADPHFDKVPAGF